MPEGSLVNLSAMRSRPHTAPPAHFDHRVQRSCRNRHTPLLERYYNPGTEKIGTLGPLRIPPQPAQHRSVRVGRYAAGTTAPQGVVGELPNPPPAHLPVPPRIPFPTGRVGCMPRSIAGRRHRRISSSLLISSRLARSAGLNGEAFRNSQLQSVICIQERVAGHGPRV